MTRTMRSALLEIAALCSMASVMRAQSATGIATVAAAAVAPAAWSRANTALASHDTALARREIDRAASAWPIQPAYIWAQALLAQLAADTNATYRALEAYAALGLGR